MTCRNTRALVGVVLALTLASRASAQEMRVTGYAETDHIGYFEPDEAERRAGRNELLTQIDGFVAFGRPLRAFASVELRADFADHSRDRVYVEELYADVVHGALDLRVGRQIIAWGKADLVNPTDHLAPRDFTDPLESDEERLGVLAVRPRIQWGGVLWEGAIVPVFTASIMPAVHSRWAPPFPVRAPDPLHPGQMMRLTYEFMPAREPATTFENMQYAARISASARGWDVSASYFDGWEDQPRFDMALSVGDAGTGTVRITPEHLRKRAVGGDVATVVRSFTVRAEAAYIRTDPLQGPDYVQYVLGVERTFGDMLGSGGTFLLVQWIQSIVPSNFVAAPLDFNYLFQKATTVRLQRNVTAVAQVAVEGLYEWERKGYYVQPAASYRFGDHVRVEGLIDLLGGRETEFFGLFADNRRLQVRMRYSF
jgi:hypothetical protein